jgi:diaminopimelate epimerase
MVQSQRGPSRRRVTFAKGHATGSDFLLVLDMPAALDLPPSGVSALCDRQQGMGADAVLRVTVAGSAREAGITDVLPSGVTDDDWFMDYRSTGGSPMRWCGNGLRVFAHYLWAAGLERRPAFVVGTVDGAHHVAIDSYDPVAAEVTAETGVVRTTATAGVILGDRAYTGACIDVGGPHLACLDSELTPRELNALDLDRGVAVDGGNDISAGEVAILTAAESGGVSTRHAASGEGGIYSYGNGAVAAAGAALRHQNLEIGALTVATPAGTLSVEINGSTSHLRGPSVLLAHGELSGGWWAESHEVPAPRDELSSPSI